jgi:hypothetical protein
MWVRGRLRVVAGRTVSPRCRILGHPTAADSWPPSPGPTKTVIFLFTAGALSFYDAAVFDNSATAYARLNLPH